MRTIEDEADYTIVVETYSNLLFRVAFQHTENRTDAEDVVQDAFIRLLQRNRPFKDENHLKAWLLRVTINLCRDLHRSFFRSRTILTDELSETAHSENTFFDPVMSELFELPKDDRICLYLHYYEGYSIREVAKLVGKSEAAVNSRIARARKKLERRMANE